MIYTIEQIKNKSKEVFDNQDFVKDIDFMIVLNRAVGMEFFGLYHFLQKEFQKDVDVLTEKEAYDIMPESIERDKVKIYGDE